MSIRYSEQVFVDLTGRRFRLIKFWLAIFMMALTVLMATLTMAVFWPPFPTYKTSEVSKTPAPLAKDKVLLIFDGGPDKNDTAKVINTLKQYQVPAVFLVSGYNILTQNDQPLRQIYEEGYEIGNDGYINSKIGFIHRFFLIRLELVWIPKTGLLKLPVSLLATLPKKCCKAKT
jgi:hypothetical protein